ncbi:hypothetical protein B5V02_02580 [Mesorhizobium kowhaii]|uniref:GS catalytic domain-containing protein n=1 Tax=Mesorhizobium kowhaii TaxID=1300272 RepID=A0A2W7E6W7_9HYPH|nr:hypothetical protein B5V02_02580 [Mesorhizobium kowhaii]
MDRFDRPCRPVIRLVCCIRAVSDFCAEAFGVAFRDNYAESRRAEQAAFDAWQASHITDFEWQRYFVS